MAEASLRDLASRLGAELFENEPMSRHTTFQIGGPAEYFIVPHDLSAAVGVVRFCGENGVPLLPLGNGSNLLVSDRGIDGAVLWLGQLGSITQEGETLRCSAGTRLSDVCVYARDHGLSGLEFAYGIPGTVGGAVFMNAGAYGGEMKDIVKSVDFLGEDGVPGRLTGARLGFGYRTSAFAGAGRLITGAELSLRRAPREQIAAKMKELLECRKQKQPLEYPSAGSVFKRPEGYYAGPLIEGCGLKGLRRGGAAVSEKHAGFIVNLGGATCADVTSLIAKIKDEVLRQTGVALESEIRMVGRPG